MIVLDTHIWRWFIDLELRSKLTKSQMDSIVAHLENCEAGVSVVSCWEIAKKVELGKLQLRYPVEDWISMALSYPGIQLLNLTPQIAIESTKLPGSFHRDPMDQIIVATARIYNCPLVTSDEKLLDYPYVKTIR